MNRKFLAVLSLVALTTAARADLQLSVVSNYDLAETESIWKKNGTDTVPQALIKNEVIGDPSSSYSAVFPHSFLQEEMFTVCFRNCENKDPFNVKKDSITTINGRAASDIIEQSSVYFYLRRYYKFLEERLYYRPEKFLKVLTNREVKDEIQGKVMKNNAFFNPRDITLSFLPATNNLLFRMLGGKINRSGFDPSVIIHEASHYLFHHLFPNALNAEIGGLNEGFADYIANIFLENPKVGLVMLQGRSIRDSESPMDASGKVKTYEPKMEVHVLGERVSLALWKTRRLADDKHEFDRMVIETVAELNQNPYSTVHDFKRLVLQRLPGLMTGQNVALAEVRWEAIFPGEAAQVENLDFLKKPIKATSFIGFNVKQTFSKEFAREMGVKEVEKFNLNVLKTETISEKQVAILAANETETVTTPYWVVQDTERSNILGIYDLTGKLVTDAEELRSLELLISKVTDAGPFIKDFMDKTRAFAELSKGKGEFNLVYKVTDRSVFNETITFNGVASTAQRMELHLRRRLLTVLFGLPQITKISLVTLPASEVKTKLPEVDGRKIIGYQLQFKSGTSMEVVLNKHGED